MQLWALVHGLASLEVRGFLGPEPAAVEPARPRASQAQLEPVDLTIESDDLLRQAIPGVEG